MASGKYRARHCPSYAVRPSTPRKRRHRQAAALTQAGIVGWPVRLTLLVRELEGAVLALLEPQNGYLAFITVIPCLALRLSTIARVVHRAETAPTVVCKSWNKRAATTVISIAAQRRC